MRQIGSITKKTGKTLVGCMEYIHFGVPSFAGRMDNIAATEQPGKNIVKTYASEFGMNIQKSLHSTLYLTAKSPLAFIYTSLSRLSAPFSG